MSATKGFSLLGLILVIAVGAIAIPPMMVGISLWLKQGMEAARMEEAVQLAVDLMEEILSKEFCDPVGGYSSFGRGPDETSRMDYDDVDDFHGWSASPPQDRRGNILSQYGGFSRSVVVENVPGDSLNTLTPSDPGTTDYKRITVQVSWQANQIQLIGLKVYGYYDHFWFGGV